MNLEQRMWKGKHPYFWAQVIILLHPIKTLRLVAQELWDYTHPRVGDVRLRKNAPAQEWDGKKWRERVYTSGDR